MSITVKFSLTISVDFLIISQPALQLNGYYCDAQATASYAWLDRNNMAVKL